MQIYDTAELDYSTGKPRTEPKQKNTILQDIKRLLDLTSEKNPKISLFVPHPKDYDIIFSCSDARAVAATRLEMKEVTH